MGSGPSLPWTTESTRHLGLKLQAFQLMERTDRSQEKLCQLYFLFNYTSNTKSEGLLNYSIFDPDPELSIQGKDIG